jgi:hypothetical protein
MHLVRPQVLRDRGVGAGMPLGPRHVALGVFNAGARRGHG